MQKSNLLILSPAYPDQVLRSIDILVLMNRNVYVSPFYDHDFEKTEWSMIKQTIFVIVRQITGGGSPASS